MDLLCAGADCSLLVKLKNRRRLPDARLEILVTESRIYGLRPISKILLCAVLISKNCHYLLPSSLPDPSELSTMELLSAFLLASALPSLTCCFLSRTQPAIRLRVCECVSCVASGCKCRASGRLGCVKGSGQGSREGFV